MGMIPKGRRSKPRCLVHNGGKSCDRSDCHVCCGNLLIDGVYSLENRGKIKEVENLDGEAVMPNKDELSNLD